MFLPLPTLDDRRWFDLVEEARALIPLYAPEWTDHNVSDPGITFAELFAWLAEMDLFQLDQVPARHRLKFLALLGIAPQPPVPAGTVLRFDVPAGSPPVLVPSTTEYQGKDPHGDAVRVRTLYPVHVVAAQVQRIQARHVGGTTELTDRWQRGQPFLAMGSDPRPGTALVLGLSAPLPADVAISIAVTVADPPASAHLDSAHHSARIAWELRLGPGRWYRLPTVDTTRSLTQSGRVEFTIPVGVQVRPGEPGYLRCRIVAGAYDAAPLLRDVALNGVPAVQSVPAGVMTWSIAANAAVHDTAVPGTYAHVGLRLDADGRISDLDFADPGAPRFFMLDFRAPAPSSPGVLSVEANQLGVGTGEPEQVFVCVPAPVAADSLRLYTLDGTGVATAWHRWTLRPDLDASTPGDRHAVLDPTTGAVLFGDGKHGLAVPDAAIVAAYRHTRAQAGTLATGTVADLADSPHNTALLAGADGDAVRRAAVTNPIPVEGGAAAETLEHAVGRAAELAYQPTRAITTADYEALARQTPGVRLARVTAVADAHPGMPCVQAIGVMTVLVLPYLPEGRPVPSCRLLRAVADHLCHLRLIGTRVEVTGPTYTEVTVRARVQGARPTSRTELTGRIAQALNAFFDPLRGGPDGGGWPFGRDVYRLEVMQVLDEVPGVEHVLELELLTAGGAQCGNICLGPNGLVAAGPHEIEVLAP